jgi:hypothetical protein
LAKVFELVQSEKARLDPGRLDGLYGQLDQRLADRVVCRTVDEVAARLDQCEALWRQELWGELRKCARSLIAISDQLGLMSIANVARDVTRAIDSCDLAAVGATLCRLLRIGEQSLLAMRVRPELSG